MAGTGPGAIRVRVAASGDIEMLTRTSDARSWIVAHIPAAVLKGVVEQSRAYRSGELVLEVGNGRLALSPPAEASVGRAPQSLSLPVFQPGIRLTLRYPRAMVRPGELLSAMLPFLMWIAAIVITWVVVNGLLLRPLGTMRRAVEAYTAGDRSIRLLPLDPPGLEAARLAAAFDGMADAAAVHENEIELSMDRQRDLTREVHHRVKNNLQVISSLLSVQSRNAATPEVAAAYASIQQRVDALALVHRHHYAEAEISQGIDLRTLLGELANALQANFFTMAGQPLDLTLKSGPLRGLQDTALPMAFLLTEVTATLADLTGDRPAKLDVMLEQLGAKRSTLTFASPTFIGNDVFSIQSGLHHARIVQGLARQLRGTLVHDPRQGAYRIELTTVSNPA
jgi:two-component system, sensor histidine kinase PdtaS